VQTAGAGRRTHFDTGAISTLITSYVASLVTVLVLGPIDIVRLILVAGLFALNVTSLTRVHVRLVSRPRSTDYALFTVNVAPYAYLLYPRPPAWLVIPAILLALFMVEVTRGRGRSALARQEVSRASRAVRGSEARSFHQTSALKPASSPSCVSPRRLKRALPCERRCLSMDLITLLRG